MLNLKIDINTISKATGLSLSDIKKLQPDTTKVSEKPTKYSTKPKSKKGKKRK